jgi:hypothetical protein
MLKSTGAASGRVLRFQRRKAAAQTGASFDFSAEKQPRKRQRQ